MIMLLVLLLYGALIFLMKYKTEIIRMKKKILKDYDYKFYIYEWLWVFVWLSFGIVLISCLVLYLKTRKTLKKYEKEFLAELKTLSEAEKKLF